MGLFGSRTTTYVSSQIYNLAGNYSERTNYLKQLVLGGVINNQSVGETIINGTITGPRMDYQSFFKWAKRNYEYGVPKGGIFKASTIESSLIKPFIPTLGGWGISITSTNILFGEYQEWAEEYVINNYPERFFTEWYAEFDEETYEIKIVWEDMTDNTFTPTDFDPKGRYIMAVYNYTQEPIPGDPGTVITDGDVTGPLASILSLPDVDLYTLESEDDFLGETKEIYKTVRTIKTYSDSRPDTDDTVSTLEDSKSYDRFEQTYIKIGGFIADPLDREHKLRRKYEYVFWQEPRYTVTTVNGLNIVEIEPGVFETTEIITKTPAFDFPAASDWYYDENGYDIDWGYAKDPLKFKYLIGSGEPDLDALDVVSEDNDGWFPCIPLRINNVPINDDEKIWTGVGTETYKDHLYPHVKKVWKKASWGKIDKLLEQIEDNPNIKDIDYSLVHYGVCLNTLSKEGRLYIYHFLRKLMIEQSTSAASYAAFLAQQAALTAHQLLVDAFNSGTGPDPGPFPEPVIMIPAKTTIRLNYTIPELDFFDFRIEWRNIEETTHVGLISPTATLRSVIIRKAEAVTFENRVTLAGTSLGGGSFTSFASQVIDNSFEVLYQETENTYRILRVYGMEHRNYVYGGKYVGITSDTAIDDVEDSGFIIPLQYSSLKAMPLVQANQLCIEAALIVFNCFLIHKKKWYETFIGQLLIGLVFIVVSAVFTGGASLLGGRGILGSNVAIGGALGLSGLSAALVGAVANVIAGQLINAIVGKVLTKVFGAKFAAIFGVVFGIVMQGFSKGLLGGEFNFSFNTFLKADNLLKLTNGVLNAYSIHLQEKTQKVYAATDKMLRDYARQDRKMESEMIDLFGYSVNFYPMQFTEIMESPPESRDSFIGRTLLTGSDISDLTHAMISEFAGMNLDLEMLKGN
jgi:hypothetical protein